MSDGLTLEAHLMSGWRQTGKMPERLDVPPIPYELEYIWDWWQELDKIRPSGMELQRIDHLMIESWSRLEKIGVVPFEVRCIMALDSAYVRCYNQQHAKDKAADKQ